MRTATCPFSGQLELPKDIIFCDLTLREGEQSPGVCYSLEEKVELVKRLDEFGLDQIQIGHPGLNENLLELCKMLCSLPLKAKTEVMTSGMDDHWKEAIDAADACGSDILHSSFEVSHFNRKVWDEQVKENILARVTEVTHYLLTKNKIVNISFTDAMRADFTFLMACIEAAAKAGANRIRICDSHGVGTPESFYFAVSSAVRIVNNYSCIIGVHIHNDFGLALANVLASLRAGARLVDLCANGLGDRAGNADLVETVITLEALYKAPTGMKVEKSIELAKYVEQLSGIPIPSNKPFVGRNVFCESNAYHAMETYTRPVYGRAIVPEDIGAELGIIYGKLTDKQLLSATAKAANRVIDEKLYPEILKRLAEEDQKAKGIPLYEEDLWRIVESVENTSRE